MAKDFNLATLSLAVSNYSLHLSEKKTFFKNQKIPLSIISSRLLEYVNVRCNRSLTVLSGPNDVIAAPCCFLDKYNSSRM